jgi:3-deoxy-7-phosphoheptulonate synthase
MNEVWSKNSWRKFPVEQQPQWPDIEEFNRAIENLSKLPSLVFSGETRRLIDDLCEVNQGRGFVLQVGHCSESFDDCNGPRIHNFLRIVLQMAIVLGHSTGKKIIKIGRVAGQYAKPRSSSFEEIGGVSLPVYRGDIVNSFNPTITERTPKASNLLEGYFRAAATLNLIRAFTQGGYSDLRNLGDWKHHFFSESLLNHKDYNKFENSIVSSLAQSTNPRMPSMSSQIIYVSHEALLLDYEEAFVRIDTTSGGSYSTSAHTLWIGNRTRQVNGAHIEFVRGLGNPVGIKISHEVSPDELNLILDKINPENRPGKVMLICRFGKQHIDNRLPQLMSKVSQSNVIWICDPMHGNTFSHGGFKVRAMEDIMSELQSFFRICKNLGKCPGGVHLEITGEYVSECIGGMEGITLSDVPKHYVTKVDPRLNAAQALELSFMAAEYINKQKS